MSHPLFTNRLINEKSPYLLQHAHNPVDWYPWGEEAFKASKEQDKPIFLSIGYATCHWCHVMEEESFENVELAKLLNDTFINIKVDREELPEVDSLYMEFAQAIMAGGAGWPLNVILTPELMPFFATTYLPPDTMRGFVGLKQLIMRIQQIWQDREEKENVMQQAGKIVEAFASQANAVGEELPGQEEIGLARELIFKSADPIYGGTKGAPKFPLGIQLSFLLRVSRRTSDSRALFYIEKTLDMMHRGGIYDHIGGGFSRYAIDERWLVPHFEKMLYDNAILARTYLEAWDYTRNNNFREIGEEILAYLEREMRHEQGGFFSAEDADSEGEEGKFYTWTIEEIRDVLGKDAHLFCEFYGVTPTGNYEGKNILHMPHSIEEFATLHHIEPEQLSTQLAELRAKLFQVREKRVRPLLDDKVIASWNGLAIYAFAYAGQTLQNSHFLDIAENAARFILEHNWVNETLLRRWRDGEAKFDGCLDDYAFMINGCLTLFEADRSSEWLEFAMTLTNVLSSEFKAEEGAFYLTNGRDPNILFRRCEFYDGAEPSGNAVHADNLIRLYQMTGNRDYIRQAEEILKAAKLYIDTYPPGTCYQLMSLQRLLNHEAPTLVIALNDLRGKSRRDCPVIGQSLYSA